MIILAVLKCIVPATFTKDCDVQLIDYKSQLSMDDKFKERLKEKLLQPRDEHQSVVSRTTSNHLPSDNLSSKDVDMSNFFNKEEPSKDSSNHDPSNNVAKYFKHSDQPSFPPLPFGNKESPSPESPSPTDSAAHMIHVGISHDNNSNAAMDTVSCVCCHIVCVYTCMCVYCM